jgi:hypothetical protein
MKVPCEWWERNMTRTHKALLILAALALLLSPMGAHAQATLTSTTLSAAVTSESGQTIRVTSATGFSIDYLVFVDAEAMRVTAISGTAISVRRGTSGTNGTTHASGATVYVGPANYFSTKNRAGSCTSTNELVLPVINVVNANIFQCTSSLWVIIGGPVNAGLTLTAPTLVTPVFTSSTGRPRYCSVPVGSVAYGSMGTSKTPVATETYYAEVFVPRSVTLTGVSYLIGGTGGTDKAVGAIYASAGGAVLAQSAAAGATVGTNDTFQDLAFTATYAAAGPARYWIAVQINGTTARLRTIAASTFVDVLTKKSTGDTFGTLASLTVPTTFTADLGPIACVY